MPNVGDENPSIAQLIQHAGMGATTAILSI